MLVRKLPLLIFQMGNPARQTAEVRGNNVTVPFPANVDDVRFIGSLPRRQKRSTAPSPFNWINTSKISHFVWEPSCPYVKCQEAQTILHS